MNEGSISFVPMLFPRKGKDNRRAMTMEIGTPTRNAEKPNVQALGIICIEGDKIVASIAATIAARMDDVNANA
jgi:hypothetical protein